MSLFYLKRKFAYWFKARHRSGHGIHSPYLFGLLTNVVENHGRYYAYDILETAWGILRKSDFSSENETYRLKSFLWHYDFSLKYGKMLFRLVNEFQPEHVLYVGPTTGMNLLYLAKADSRIPVDTFISNCPSLPVMKRLLASAKIENVKVHETVGELFSGIYRRAFVVLNLSGNPEYSKGFLLKMKENLENSPEVIVLYGIHENPEAENLWTEVKHYSFVRVSLDFFTLGIAICLPELQKEDFVIRY